MARITVEDCIDKFPSRFELVLVASNRARKLFSGDNPTVEIDNDKNTVIALREIAEETLTKEQLKNDLIEEYQTNILSEDEDINELEDNSNEDQSEVNEMKIEELHQVDQEFTNELEDNSNEDQSEVNEMKNEEVQQVDQNDDEANDKTILEASQENLDATSNEEKAQDL